MKKIFLSAAVILMLFSCDAIEDALDKSPEIDEDGVVLSLNRVAPFDSVQASVSAKNPGKGPLRYIWSCNEGGTFTDTDLSTVYWKAPIEGGDYRIRVKVKNDDGEDTANRIVHVISYDDPLVDIQSPAEDQYYVLSQTVRIKAFAFHDNGVNLVNFYANGSLKGQASSHSNNIYEYSLNLDSSALVGKIIIKVEAVSNSSTTGSDEITIDVGGIVPGKNGN